MMPQPRLRRVSMPRTLAVCRITERFLRLAQFGLPKLEVVPFFLGPIGSGSLVSRSLRMSRVLELGHGHARSLWGSA